jgi:hypothetical protein
MIGIPTPRPTPSPIFAPFDVEALATLGVVVVDEVGVLVILVVPVVDVAGEVAVEAGVGEDVAEED